MHIQIIDVLQTFGRVLKVSFTFDHGEFLLF